MQSERPEARCRLNIPLLEACDLAARSYDVAMSGEIMAGSIVFLKHTAIDAIIPGGVYVIVSKNYVLLRKVHPAVAKDGRAIVKLEAAAADYDTVDIPSEDIVEMYRVVGNLKLG